jgi:BirA family transcriptional regulator, biotin operon repressor / biotin---[acetyl-CoA-carboxylase] ligase
MPEAVPEEFAAALADSAARRGSFGQPLFFHSETTSTNDRAIEQAERGAPDGTTVIALAQTAGRGRLGRAWFSPPGAGLYASVICRNAAATALLTLAGGVAVAEGIVRASGLPVAIKWPNDVVAVDGPSGKRRKVAGVLAEGSTGSAGLQYVVLGFGINIKPAAYPAELGMRATSLEAELGRQVDAGRVLAEVLVSLNEQLTALAAGHRARVLKKWRELSPLAVGAAVEWTGQAGARGTTAGIDDDGALLVRVQDRIERIIAGEVRWL